MAAEALLAFCLWAGHLTDPTTSARVHCGNAQSLSGAFRSFESFVRKKRKQQRRRARSSFATAINQALNGVLAQQPQRVIVEDLTHLRGKAKGKQMSRTVSLWMRRTLNERADFTTAARGSRLQAVDSADTSQEWAHCGFTAEENRKGDHFRCWWCGTADTADGNAAKVIGKRADDPEFNPWMTKFHIKKILDRRNAQITGATLAPVVKAASLVEDAAHR
jgi:transposase